MVHVRVGRARRVDAVFIHRLEERGVALQLAAGLNGQKKLQNSNAPNIS